MCLWNTDVPGGNKVKIRQKSLRPTFWPSPAQPRGMWCQWSVRNSYMNLRSKFCYSIITQTLNIALCKRDGITDRQTNGRTDDPITRCPRRTFQAGSIKIPEIRWVRGGGGRNVGWEGGRTMTGFPYGFFFVDCCAYSVCVNGAAACSIFIWLFKICVQSIKVS